MPGIVGLISRRPSQECESLVEAMLASMKHEAFYVSGTYSASEMGIYAGWMAHENSFAAQQVFFNEQRDVALVFSGECLVDRETRAQLMQKGHELDSYEASWLVHLYEEKGDKFFEELDGLFSGLLIDKRQRKAFLFNDRYGLERIYWLQTADGFFFASEAKAVLRVQHQCRAFDQDGVADFLNFGCTTEWRTLFRNLTLMPGGSRWCFDADQCRKERYFSPETWESQPVLSEDEFNLHFAQTFKRLVPRYLIAQHRLGISLTGGLDTRMIMACGQENLSNLVSFTYSGEDMDTLDARLAKRIARACGVEHHVLRIGSDFFSNFAQHADRTVYVTDGCFGVTGAHEIYMSRLARQLAPIRLTGNFGSEVLRGVSTFKPVPLRNGLFDSELRRRMDISARRMAGWRRHDTTFAAFCEVPWNLFGNLAAGRSQIGFRTPYLANEIVMLAYRAPLSLRHSHHNAIHFVNENHPILGAIPTDKGYLGNSNGLIRGLRRGFAELTFKLDYVYNEGLPNSLSRFDWLVKFFMSTLGGIGLHKHLHYRSWFKRELAVYLWDVVSDSRTQSMPLWNGGSLARLVREHTSGRKNFVREIDTILTLEAVDRLLLHH